MNNREGSWTACLTCQGRGKKSKGLSKKVKRRYQKALDQLGQASDKGTPPIRPKGHLATCLNCNGSGLVQAEKRPEPDQSLPHIAIIGGGIGGMALAVACLYRRIPFTLYERDSCFDVRSQGYGLTLQQASRAIDGLGIVSLREGVVSTRHVIHTTEGEVIGDWGIKDLQPTQIKETSRRTNVHIARQSLRLALLEQLGGSDAVRWGHQLVSYKECASGEVDLKLQVEGSLIHAKADLVVGADGIRSSVRSLLLGKDATPLRYLGCIVILGICPLAALHSNTLLDSSTVFQTANGHERIYVMPYDSDSVMWQLSFPMAESDAKALSAQGSQALKEEAIRRCQWHDPIPQILAATPAAQVSGYPVYDRALLEPEFLRKATCITLIGDAAHPMSPFKGQGANQALLDAIALAQAIAKSCRPLTEWRALGIRDSMLNEFEADMLARSASKVRGSADAAQFLHSDIVLHKGNEPRGRCLLRKEDGS